MIENFKMYVQNFDFNDENISRKYFHSLRVMGLCRLISISLNLDDDEVNLTEVIGLLHDYGRFMQWTLYHTFRDAISIDHGDYGVQQLFGQNEITHFWNHEEDYDEIYDAIKYHNKYSVPDNISQHNRLLCDIVRDADKLDILYLYISNSLIFPEDGNISSEVKESFEKEELVFKQHEHSQADHGIALLALVYDLNFSCSFRHLKKYKIIEQIYSTIKDKDKFAYYFEKIFQYIDYHCK